MGPWLSIHTSLAFNINAALEQGHLAQFSFEDIYQQLERGTLITFLADRLHPHVDLSLIEASPEQRPLLIDALLGVAETVRGDELRKMGVSRCGLCLLQGLVLEAIQKGAWVPRPA